MTNLTQSEAELRETILTEFKQVLKLAPADYTENCTNVVISHIQADREAYGDTRELEGLENIMKQLPAFQKLTDEQEEQLLGKLVKQRLSTLRTELSKKEKQS